jgi:hypothetical protein
MTKDEVFEELVKVLKSEMECCSTRLYQTCEKCNMTCEMRDVVKLAKEAE